ncbi:MAG: DegT/DnrJ/EryC1/StrS family aminotransferase [Candidatus Accumulibacter sp.]|jgi:dTDP-4-amino-4,6-dideoxygalactose transaminase|uniref:DegT/DnrJ/EryC1/StrS family aminotransferase n=1 Tax=Accumulibacter sp. TaxID=2053492 RepID=UPI00258BA221|nr:DegT/DnrJ/EryC1/StrS family aminotransferase [Accumulibacter sp.]MBK8117199.1 DegT/DnrJ/EryC1/StrS family aminotransferase [Accumulibacter sp.]
MPEQPIFLTRPYLPPLEEFLPYLEEIWASRRLTNGGPFHQQFEEALRQYLGVPHVCLFTNGTLALMTALQALRITGEVITTPYTFAATAHALLWNGIKPVFVDVRRDTCNLDEELVEAAITPRTTAILPVHCYGNPCADERLQQIADTYGLKLIYDAAHTFGVTVDGHSLLEQGDLAVLSFHATKVFNTFEGGAIVCHDAKLKQRIDYLKNFGFADEVTVVAPGINGKMNEFQAALGLLQLNYVEQAIAARLEIARRYREALAEVPGVESIPVAEGVRSNGGYFPVLIGPEYAISRDQLYDEFRRNSILVRRYFYPLISDLPMYRGIPSAAPANLPVATQIARQVLCLPIYPDIEAATLEQIIDIFYRSR